MPDEELSFREKLVQEFSRDELLELLHDQDPELAKQVRRIEWVFENKLRHLTWTDGSPIEGRPVTKEELALLIDEPFSPDRELTRMGVSIEQQHKLHIAKDPVLWARHFLNQQPRVYQIIMLRHPNTRKVLRAGRRLGKTFCMALMLLHYSYTTKNGKCLVVAPMKSHVGLIYEEIMKMVQDSPVLESITRNVTSPQYEINFSNGATVRFFTSGMKSGGKADVARGQEAHLIVLDELDYMGEEDLVALYAMLQKTSAGQADKVLVGASTPTGQHGQFWRWCHSDRFSEFYYPSYCFPAGPLVSMADGSLKPIESIMANDLVLTENGAQRVVKTFRREYEGPIRAITTYGNNRSLLTTPEHPFAAANRVFKQTNFDWKWTNSANLNIPEKNNLSSGTWLRSIHKNGEYASLVKKNEEQQFKGYVYNFEVENTNSYVIEGLLVHNCNPEFDRNIEEEMREQYDEMQYRHEIEADWGEDTEGVYPRKYVDIAFKAHGEVWKYEPVRPPGNDNIYLMGVDWDKYGAGVNIVIVEICSANHPVDTFRGKVRLIFREEVRKGDYTLLDAVDRIIYLNAVFNPTWIYVDRGYGEAQMELLKRHGVENPMTRLNKKVIGHTFSDSIEMPDPQTKLMAKKEIKPFMISNLRQMLEQEMIIFPEHDEDLYLQLISYVVRSVSVYGRETFEMSGGVPDHAHDALILACLAYAIKYSELMKLRLATRSYTISNEAFLSTFEIANDTDAALAEETWGSPSSAPIKVNRPMTAKRVNMSRSIRRSSF